MVNGDTEIEAHRVLGASPAPKSRHTGGSFKQKQKSVAILHTGCLSRGGVPWAVFARCRVARGHPIYMAVPPRCRSSGWCLRHQVVPHPLWLSALQKPTQPHLAASAFPRRFHFHHPLPLRRVRLRPELLPRRYRRRLTWPRYHRRHRMKVSRSVSSSWKTQRRSSGAT